MKPFPKAVLYVLGSILVIVAILFASRLANAGGSKAPKVGEPPSHRKPASGAAVYKVPNNFTLKSCADVFAAAKKLKGSTAACSDGKGTWDLKGGILDGVNQKGDGGQNENQENLASVRLKLIIRNGFVRNTKNGLTLYAVGSGVERLTFTHVGEDALATTRGAYDITIKDCEFIGREGNDKQIQLNEAKGARIVGNLIFGTVTGMRIGDSNTTAVSEVAEVGNNRFVDVDTAYHVSKITVKELTASKYDNVKTEWKFANGGKRK